MRQAETIMAHLTGYNQWKNIHKLTRLKWDTTHALTLIACFSVFLVVSDDMLWCKMNLAAPDTFMVGGTSPQVSELCVCHNCFGLECHLSTQLLKVDLAIMALCNASIIGT